MKRKLTKEALERMAAGGRKCRGRRKQEAGRKGYQTMRDNLAIALAAKFHQEQA